MLALSWKSSWETQTSRLNSTHFKAVYLVFLSSSLNALQTSCYLSFSKIICILRTWEAGGYQDLLPDEASDVGRRSFALLTCVSMSKSVKWIWPWNCSSCLLLNACARAPTVASGSYYGEGAMPPLHARNHANRKLQKGWTLWQSAVTFETTRYLGITDHKA